jgi:ABC-type polysaccharide/polyol phosphate export permease
MGISGLVSSDRQQGHFRFLFSKPVNVPAFYAQAFAVHLVAFVVIAAGLAALLGVLTAPAAVLAAAQSAALTFVLVGGLGLLFGSLLRLDGAVLVLVYLISSIVQQIDTQQPGVLPGWASTLGQLLPPVNKLDQVRTHLFAGQAPVYADLWHVLGYGALAGVVGLLVLRRAPLAR